MFLSIIYCLALIIASRDKKYGGCRICAEALFSSTEETTCFLEGGGTAIMMPDGRERDETIMEARLRLENQHLRLGQHDRTTAFSVIKL